MMRLSSFRNYFSPKLSSCSRFCLFKANPLWLCLCYFLTLSLLGFMALSVSSTRTNNLRPKSLDFFFTSVSASTDSSMATVEMEVFSNTQLVIMTILMLLGGEVFMSMLSLHFMKSRLSRNHSSISRSSGTVVSRSSSNQVNQIELDLVSPYVKNNDKIITIKSSSDHHDDDICLKYNSVKLLSYVVVGYLLVVHIGGTILVSLYIVLVPSARQVLDQKGLHINTFSVFTTVSTFSNCGFVPTNENMMVFKKNSGLLLILIPQILLGNTLYPACLRLVIWALHKATKKPEFDCLLRRHREIGYYHLLSGIHSCLLAVTVLGFIMLQWVLLCCLEWNSEAMDGLNSYQKLVATLFQVINSRYTGEYAFDISVFSPAILVLFIVMMYLPPYTTFFPRRYRDDQSTDSKNLNVKQKETTTFMECLIFSQLSYLTMFIIMVCITERHKMKEDPLNFNVLFFTIEVISAYGNVGFSSGYSCGRRVRADGACKDTGYGLVGRWSSLGKFILIIVMFFGRIQLFNLNGGKSWKLS